MNHEPLTKQPRWPFALGMFQRAQDKEFIGIVDPQWRVCRFTDLLNQAQWPQALPYPDTVFSLVEHWEAAFPALERAVRDRLHILGAVMEPLASYKALAPVAQARQLICTGANYRKHVIDLVVAQGAGAESVGHSVEERREQAARRVDERVKNGIPYAFPKLVSSITGPYSEIVVPKDAQQLDWELELGVVIGRPGWRVPRERALDWVAGYTIVNDLTRRELVYRQDLKSLGSDWLRAKSGPGFFPMGPLLVPAKYVRPENLRMRLRVGEQTMQDESTADMLWDVSAQIAYVSSYARLLPGDVIATGSPAGNGMHHGRFLAAGDVMTGEIEELGMQINRIIAEEGHDRGN